MCVVSVDAERWLLHVANLGDSGVLVIRDGVPVFRTPEQEHSLGVPFQLSSQKLDMPHDAQAFRVPLEKGDVVLVATDGMFDNAFDEDIAAYVQQAKLLPAEQLAAQLVQGAYRNAGDRHKMTPFARAAREELGLIYDGGKMDDITVVLGKVVEAPKTGR